MASEDPAQFPDTARPDRLAHLDNEVAGTPFAVVVGSLEEVSVWLGIAPPQVDAPFLEHPAKQQFARFVRIGCTGNPSLWAPIVAPPIVVPSNAEQRPIEPPLGPWQEIQMVVNLPLAPVADAGVDASQKDRVIRNLIREVFEV